jgi:hypothetical protein
LVVIDTLCHVASIACYGLPPFVYQLAGWIFLAATLDGIVELMFCESF